MKVFGHKIEQGLIDRLLAELNLQTNFTTREVERRLIDYGVRVSICYRASDRMVQKWRKDGKIFYDKGNQCWRPIKHYDAIYGRPYQGGKSESKQ